MITLLVGFLLGMVIVGLVVSLFPNSTKTVSSTSLLEAFLEHTLQQQQQQAQPQGGNVIVLIGLIFIVLVISSLLGFPLISVG